MQASFAKSVIREAEKLKAPGDTLMGTDIDAEEREHLQKDILKIDRAIAALEAVEDEEVKQILENKKRTRAELREKLVAMKPLDVQLQAAKQKLEKIAKRSTELVKERDALDALWNAKIEEVDEIEQQREEAQQEVATLQTKIGHAPPQQGPRTADQWALGLEASLAPVLAESFRQWMIGAHQAEQQAKDQELAAFRAEAERQRAQAEESRARQCQFEARVQAEQERIAQGGGSPVGAEDGSPAGLAASPIRSPAGTPAAATPQHSGNVAPSAQSVSERAKYRPPAMRQRGEDQEGFRTPPRQRGRRRNGSQAGSEASTPQRSRSRDEERAQRESGGSNSV